MAIAQSEVATYQDKFLYRINEKVISLEDLTAQGKDLLALKCHIPDSILSDFLGRNFYQKMTEFERAMTPENTKIKDHPTLLPFMAYLRQLSKMRQYIDGQDVTLAPQLMKEMVKSSKNGKCPSILRDGQLTLSFLSILRMEVYLRSRYAQGRHVEGQEASEKRAHSIALFIDSLDKQMLHENFW